MKIQKPDLYSHPSRRPSHLPKWAIAVLVEKLQLFILKGFQFSQSLNRNLIWGSSIAEGPNPQAIDRYASLQPVRNWATQQEVSGRQMSEASSVTPRLWLYCLNCLPHPPWICGKIIFHETSRWEFLGPKVRGPLPVRPGVVKSGNGSSAVTEPSALCLGRGQLTSDSARVCNLSPHAFQALTASPFDLFLIPPHLRSRTFQEFPSTYTD